MDVVNNDCSDCHVQRLQQFEADDNDDELEEDSSREEEIDADEDDLNKLDEESTCDEWAETTFDCGGSTRHIVSIG
ncbi:hypothetical protein QYM36_019861 [Artemia franciscana]|uniref:Uncharacterized protein n=1 Tax=Artemia franciscana TaxID=6661 RepID=A0AA88H9U1_ARTSF|nr:hypothetical protein QYM36_019861 [Artemia franciscana]